MRSSTIKHGVIIVANFAAIVPKAEPQKNSMSCSWRSISTKCKIIFATIAELFAESPFFNLFVTDHCSNSYC